MSWTEITAQLETFVQGLAEGEWSRLASIASPYSLWSYGGAIIVAAAFFASRGQGRETLQGIVTQLFPKEVMGHRSTRTDMAMYAVNAILLAGAYGSIEWSSSFWAELAAQGLTSMFGPPPAEAVAPAPVILLVVAVAEVLLVDLGYWLAHAFMHKSPFMWEFHKVHHSAEVMTPLTEWRQHPIEMVLFPNVIALVVGVGYAVLRQGLGAAQPLSLGGINLFLLIFFLTISHLRHSHVWLPLTGLAGHVFHSPAHHHIHHSNQPQHFDRNMGFALSVWDWAFGTLHVPRADEHIVIGLGEENERFATLAECFVHPVRASAAHVVPHRKPTDVSTS